MRALVISDTHFGAERFGPAGLGRHRFRRLTTIFTVAGSDRRSSTCS